ncbi:MAG: hypothetical protein ACRDJE_28390 [Dehalococcoidia bacterium]
MKEIEEKYKDRWVVLVDLENDPDRVVRRARVFWHGDDHDEAWAKVDEIPPSQPVGVFYMGDPIPDGVVPIL